MTDRDKMMERTRAAVCYNNSRNNDPGSEMAAFMAIFHPEVEQETVRKMVIDARRKNNDT